MDITLVVPRMDAQSCGIRSFLGSVLPGVVVRVRLGAVAAEAVCEVSVDGSPPVPVLARHRAGQSYDRPALTLATPPEEFRARLLALSGLKGSQTLTSREEHVLSLFEEGLDLGEIADVLAISRATVQVHLAAIRARGMAPDAQRPGLKSQVARSA